LVAEAETMETIRRIYLDLCSIQRPLDTQNHIRITLEAEAVLAIISMCAAGILELVSSDALQYEASRNPNTARREYAAAVLSLAVDPQITNEAVAQRAETFVNNGIKPLDALHLALAEAAHSDYFCTCDDRFLRKALQNRDLMVRALAPLELVEELTV
jgi:predicted nucleic acid-binding protein